MRGAWWDGRLRVTIGTKYEHSDFTGVEYQPNLRVLWKASEAHTLWAAVSRAVRRLRAAKWALMTRYRRFRPPFPV